MYQLSAVSLCREIYYVNYSHVGFMFLGLKLLTFWAWFKNMLWPWLEVELIMINVIKYLLHTPFFSFHCLLPQLDCLILKQRYKLDFRWWGSSSVFNLFSVVLFFHVALFWFSLFSPCLYFPPIFSSSASQLLFRVNQKQANFIALAHPFETSCIAFLTVLIKVSS